MSRLLRRSGGRAVLGAALLLATASPTAASAAVGRTRAAAPVAVAAPWTVYVTNSADGTVTPINPQTNTAGTVSHTTGANARSIGLTKGARIYVTSCPAHPVVCYLEGWIAPGDTNETHQIDDVDPRGIAVSPSGIVFVTEFATGHLRTYDGPDAGSVSVGSGPVAVAVAGDGSTAYVVNQNDGTVVPVTVSSLTLGTPIPVGTAPDAIAITPNGSTAYVANRGSNSVTPIDLATQTAGTPITVGNGPSGIAISADGTTAVTTNSTDNTVTLIDLATATPSAPIAVGTDPEAVAITPDSTTAYVANKGSNSVTPVDLAGATAGTAIGVGSQPSALAITPDQGPTPAFTVSSASPGNPTRFDASVSTPGTSPIVSYHWIFGDGTVVTTTTPQVSHVYTTVQTFHVALGEGDVAGTAHIVVSTGQTTSRNPSAHTWSKRTLRIPGDTDPPTIYINGGTGAITPIDVASNAVGAPISVADASAIAITPDDTLALVADRNEATVTPVELATGTTETPIAVGNQPVAVAITPDGATAYVMNTGDGTITPIDIATRSAGTPITIGANPHDIVITPDGSTAYVRFDGGVAPVDLATGTVGSTITGIPDNPFTTSMAMAPDGKTLYLLDPNGSLLRVATATNTLETSISIGSFAQGLALAPDGSTAYVVTGAADAPSLTPIDLVTGTTEAAIPFTGYRQQNGIVITPDGRTAYVKSGNQLTPINLRTDQAQASLTVTSSNTYTIAITPDLAPIAAFTATPAPPGSPTDLDASTSRGPSSAIRTYVWNFGDGTTATTSQPTIQHVYAAPGRFHVQLVVHDATGTSTKTLYMSRMMLRSGGPAARAKQVVHVT